MNNNYKNFPKNTVGDDVKDSYSFGAKVAKGIKSDWFNGRMSKKNQWVNKMRSYSRGEQKTDYKSMIEGKNDDSGLIKTYKIDYSSILKIIPTFKDIITNAIDESLFKPRAEALDITAVKLKKKETGKIKESFYNQKIQQTISKGLGLDIPNDAPKTRKELETELLEYKPKLEIAHELAIENVMKMEKFESVKDKIDEDLFDLGIGVGKHEEIQGTGIKLSYVDYYNFFHSDFEMNNAEDLRYAGEQKPFTLSEILQRADRKLEDWEIQKIKDYFTPDNEEFNDSIEIECFSFVYNLSKTRVFKKLNKNKRTKLIDRSFYRGKDFKSYKPSNPSKKIELTYTTWYEGLYITELDILVKWKPVSRQIEKEKYHSICPYIINAPKVKRRTEEGCVRFDSMVDRVIPVIDDIQLDYFKLRQLKSELRPNTVNINSDAINNITLGGKKVSSRDVLALFFGRGLLLSRSFDEDGEPVDRPIKEEASPTNYSALTFLSSQFTENLNRIRQLTGVNEIRDGATSPNSRTSGAVQKLLLASSNNATNHIVKGSFMISLNFAEAISLRLKDVLQDKRVKDVYINAIGSENLDLLEEVKNIPTYHYGIYFDFRPDSDEKMILEQSLIEALRQGEINSAQYNRVRQVRNVKSATKHLQFTIQENEELKALRKQEEIKLQAESTAKANSESAINAEKVRQQTLTLAWDIEHLKLKTKDQIEEKKENRKAYLDSLKRKEEFLYAKELKLLEIQAQNKKTSEIEDRKDDRIDHQSENTKILGKIKDGDLADFNFKKEMESYLSSLEPLDTEN